MNIKIDYFDNIINLKEDKTWSIEIENPKCFFRTVNNFIEISNGSQIEELYFFDNENNEINLANKLLIVTDYFNINNTLKKYSNNLQKYIIKETKEEIVNDLSLKYKQLIEKFSKSLSNIDLPITINNEFNLEQLLKLIKPTINNSLNLLKNLYLIIDLEKTFKINKLIIFVNLKQYLTKEEIKELYKYAIYNKISIMLIENNGYNVSLENEIKLLIDSSLDEYML